MMGPASRSSSATLARRPPRSATTGEPACCGARRRSRKSCASRVRTEVCAVGAFEYTALDAGGKELKGILEGDTPRHIRQLLREKSLLPVTVSEVAQKEAK